MTLGPSTARSRPEAAKEHNLHPAPGQERIGLRNDSIPLNSTNWVVVAHR